MYPLASGGGACAFTAAPLALVLLASCDANVPAPTPDAASCERLMAPFVDALWKGETESVEGKLTLPLTAVEQRYELRESDPPYVLGPARTSTVDTRDDAAKLLATLAARVSARDDDLVPRPRDSNGTSWDAAFVGNAGAGNLRRCVITLAVGDTEHVLIAGFDSAGGKVRALYWN